MAAITRGRAILQENRTLVLGNSVSVKPFPPTVSALKKPQFSNADTTVAHRNVSFLNKPAVRPPTLQTRFVPTLAQAAFIERSYSEKKSVMLVDDVSLNKLNFGEPLKVKGTTKIIPIHYETDIKTLKIQTPPMRIPFGLSKFNPQDSSESSTSSFSLQMSFDGMDKDGEMKRFHDLITGIDELVLKAAEKNSKSWFDREIPVPVLHHTYKRSIKPPAGKHSPLFKVKIPVNYDKETKQINPQVNVFLDKKPSTIEELTNGCKVVGIVELKYVWSISGTMVGTSWNLLQVKVVEKPDSSKLTGYSFIETKEPETN